jgi:hypothetical protein
MGIRAIYPHAITISLKMERKLVKRRATSQNFMIIFLVGSREGVSVEAIVMAAYLHLMI